MKTLEKRFHRKELLTEFAFSTPDQAAEAAKVLFSPIAERVRQENQPVFPERIYVFYD